MTRFAYNAHATRKKAKYTLSGHAKRIHTARLPRAQMKR